MARRFVYVYTMKPMPEAIRRVVPEHVDYWKSRRLAGHMGGPFADRSGGLITFDAADLAEAEKIAENDPFVASGVVDSRWVKEWLPE